MINIDKKNYNGTSTLELLKYAINYNNFVTSLIKKYFQSKHQIICDFGAGIGTYCEQFSDRKVVCIEPSLNEQNILKAKGFDVSPDLSATSDNSLDYIYSLNVLEHIENDQLIITQFASKLKPGGTLFLYLPALQILWSDLDSSVNHYRRYNKKMLISLVTESFDIQELKYCDSVGGIFSIIFKLLNKKTETISKNNVVIFDRLFFPINKIFDLLFSSFFGKNIYIAAIKKH